jgi:predicted RNase H-like HicB family nuclease
LGEEIMKITVIIEQDDNGYYAFCPQLKGCHTQGDSIEEAMNNIKEAISLYLETLSSEEKIQYLSHEILTTSMEVDIA